MEGLGFGGLHPSGQRYGSFPFVFTCPPRREAGALKQQKSLGKLLHESLDALARVMTLRTTATSYLLLFQSAEASGGHSNLRGSGTEVRYVPSCPPKGPSIPGRYLPIEALVFSHC